MAALEFLLGRAVKVAANAQETNCLLIGVSINTALLRVGVDLNNIL